MSTSITRFPLAASILLFLLAGFAVEGRAEDPVVVMTADATDYTIQAPRIFYLNRPGCAPIRGEPEVAEMASSALAGAGTARNIEFVAGSTRQVVGRSAVTGMSQREIYQSFHDNFCTAPDTPEILSNVVSDGEFLYWIDDGLNGLVRVPATQMIWQTVPPQLVASHPARAAELVMAQNNIYVLESGFGGTGFYRINVSSGSVTSLLNASQAGSNPLDLQTDGVYFMWRHGSGGTTLKRFTISNGTQTDIVSGVTGFHSAIPLVGDGVYVAQGNVIRTYIHQGGSLTAPIYTGGSNVRISEINTDGSGLYFIEQNTSVAGAYTLFRLPFGQSATAIFSPPVGSATVRDLSRHQGDLFFLRGSDLLRLPTNAGAVTRTNLRIEGLEVTQAIQNNSNDVPLVRGKRAVARLFASSDGVSIDGLQAHLYRLNSGGTVIDGPLFPINLERAALFMRVQSDPDRDNISDSFTFFLPPDWLDGSELRLRAELNPYRFPLEPTYVDNVLTTSNLPIETSPRIEARFVLFEYASTSGDRFKPRFREDYQQTVSWIRRTYPLASAAGGPFDTSPGFRPSYRRVFNEDLGANIDRSIDPAPADTECGRRMRLDEDDDEFISSGDRNLCASWFVVCPALDTLRAAEELPTEIRQVGMVADDLGFPRGWACGNGNVSTPSGPGDFGWDFDGSYADWYGGHEVGHGQGRGHPSQGNEECGHSASDPGFPWTGAQIGGPGFRGFDIGSPGLNPLLIPRVYSNEWHDMMSYCMAPGQWISDYTYEGIRDFSARSVTLAENRGGAFVQISGVIDPDSRNAYVAELRKWDPLGFAPEAPVPGDYRIRFLDGGGGQLAAYDFTPFVEEEESMLIVGEFLPFVPGTNEIQITHPGTGQTSWSYSVSPNAPVVSGVGLSSPPSPVTGLVDLAWSATDADGDDLSFDVLYSDDNGNSWRALQMNLSATTVAIDTDALPGATQGRFRVIANDGFNQGEGVSPAYSVPDKPPIMTLLGPADGQEFAFSQEVNFAVDVVDPQGAEPASIQWRDQTSFMLGTGTEFSSDDLIIGENIITITAESESGLSSQLIFSIFVNDSLERPAAILTAGPTQIGWHVDDAETQTQVATMSVSNSGSGSLQVSVSSDASWLSVGQSGLSTPLELTFAADPSVVESGKFTTTEVIIQGVSAGGIQTLVVPVILARGFITDPVIAEIFSDRFQQ